MKKVLPFGTVHLEKHSLKFHLLLIVDLKSHSHLLKNLHVALSISLNDPDFILLQGDYSGNLSFNLSIALLNVKLSLYLLHFTYE